MKTYTYDPIRPDLAIEIDGSAKLGNCYYSTTYRITSRFKLTRWQIEALAAAGFLGCGQEFRILSQCDGTEEAHGTDELQCVVYDNGKRTDEPPFNPYSRDGSQYPPITKPYYVYRAERRVDSSD